MARIISTGFYDLSVPVTPNMEWWPGLRHRSAPFMWGSQPMTHEAGCSCAVRTTDGWSAHAGTHADAPSHYQAGGAPINQCDIQRYLGRCQVVVANTRRGRGIKVEDLEGEIYATRVLIFTGTFYAKGKFNTDPAYPTPELVDHLNMRGVHLLGIDGPSMDGISDSQLPSHKRLAQHGMLGIEWLDLAGVPPGWDYVLLALPLNLVGGDASPLRPVLLMREVARTMFANP